MVYRFYCMALFHSQTRRHMIKFISDLINFTRHIEAVTVSVISLSNSCTLISDWRNFTRHIETVTASVKLNYMDKQKEVSTPWYRKSKIGIMWYKIILYYYALASFVIFLAHLPANKSVMVNIPFLCLVQHFLMHRKVRKRANSICSSRLLQSVFMVI